MDCRYIFSSFWEFILSAYPLPKNLLSVSVLRYFKCMIFYLFGPDNLPFLSHIWLMHDPSVLLVLFLFTCTVCFCFPRNTHDSEMLGLRRLSRCADFFLCINILLILYFCDMVSTDSIKRKTLCMLNKCLGCQFIL